MKGIDVIVEQAGSRYQIAVVRVLGQIDTTTSHELERRLQYLLKDRQFEIVIDLGKVTYISSAGWGIFISEIRGIRESGGDLKLVGMTPEVAEVFELLEFHNILESFKTVEAAVERFEKPKTSIVSEKQKSGEASKDNESKGGSGVSGEGGSDLGRSGSVVSGTAAAAPPAHAVSPVDGFTAINDATASGQITADALSNATVDTAAAAASSAESGSTTRKVSKETAARIDSEYATTNHARPGVAGVNARGPARATGEPQTEPLSKDLEAMILEIVREHPDYGCLKIRKELLEHDYRRPMNPLALFMELKRLNLETKEKRKRYAESVAVVDSKR